MHHQQLPCASHAIARSAFACLRPLAPRRSRTHRSAAQTQPCTQHLASCASLQSSARLLSNVGKQGRCDRASLTVTNSYSKPDVPDRVVASIPYLIPLIDGLRYGQLPLKNSGVVLKQLQVPVDDMSGLQAGFSSCSSRSLRNFLLHSIL